MMTIKEGDRVRIVEISKEDGFSDWPGQLAGKEMTVQWTSPEETVPGFVGAMLLEDDGEDWLFFAVKLEVINV